MTVIYDDILREELGNIPEAERRAYLFTDRIAQRIDDVMKQKGVTKSRLAQMTGKRPCEVTKWLSGSHNFTCRTLSLISDALQADIVNVAK